MWGGCAGKQCECDGPGELSCASGSQAACPPHMAGSCGSCLLLCLLVPLSHSLRLLPSADDYDILVPYPGSHGPSHSHRYVRDCQPVVHGNVTYESWPSRSHPGSPAAESRTFVSAVGDDAVSLRWVSGHVTVVPDPLRTLSVLEPGGPGGCERSRRETVEHTARTQRCVVAQNGGYFNTSSGHCYGNVVSDGRLVQSSGGVQNAQFGIRSDGTLVFGYLSEEDVLRRENPFVQLVSGVGWLLRAGQVYINESMQAESDATQETGTFRRFVDVVSARTAVGHDCEGRLILFHIDGQTDRRGMNLQEVATFLKEQGVINAINLDGGGSSTYVLNGSLASYPSDHCSEPMWRCPRAVSTVLCVHERRCHPEDCSQHGVCVDGQCVCQRGWAEPTCANLTCQRAYCGEHGLCTENGCVCDAGWSGANCSEECTAGFYGDGCNKICMCVNGGACDPVHGRCTCPAGFLGDSCEQECPLGSWGPHCSHQCQCSDLCPCDPVSGSCNATLQDQTNSSLHKVGHCLATRMLNEWRQEEVRTSKLHLTQQSWLAVTSTLAVLLLISLIGHLIRACGGGGEGSRAQSYSYIPLNQLNGLTDTDPRRGPPTQRSRFLFQADDSESQDSS